MSKSKAFPVSVTPVARDGGYTQILFLHEELVIGTIVVHDGAKFSTIKLAWQEILKDASFKPNAALPQYVRSALVTMSKEYCADVHADKMTWKFLPVSNIYDWEITKVA